MIKSLGERMRLPRLGVIRLGIKTERGLPAEVPYFVVPDALKCLLVPQPTKIPVLFPSDDLDRVLVADYVRYSGKLCTLKCDGETFHEFPKDRTPERTVPCQKTELRKPCPCGATAKARLNVIVLEGPLGVFQVLIGGEQRIADLLSELSVFKQTLGRLTHVLFWLERIPAEVQVRKDDGTRLAKTGWPVHVRCDFTAKQALRFRQLEILGEPAVLAALPPGPLEEAETEAVAPDEDSLATGRMESAPRAESPEAEVTPPAGLDDWTLEQVTALATTCGTGPQTFREYVLARFEQPLDELPPELLAILGDELQDATATGETGKAAYKARMFAELKRVAQGKRPAMGRGGARR